MIGAVTTYLIILIQFDISQVQPQNTTATIGMQEVTEICKTSQ